MRRLAPALAPPPPPALLVAAALLAALLAPGGALADYQGTDVLSNVGPPSQVADAGALVNRHPPGHYALDTHVDTGITNPSGLVGLIPHFLASQLWDLTKFLVLTTISLFTWAFSLDLLGGGSGPGALLPVSEAVERIYAHTFGAAWLAAGIVLAGLWGIWKAFVQRRYAETAGQLALSVGFVVLALFFVHAPERTLGRASDWTNQMSLAFLAGATDASLENPGRAKAEVADHLFRTLLHEPWVVLNFGGLRHCVDAGHRPVAPHSPARERCIDHLRSAGGRGGYAERYLRYPPGSEARNAEYEAIKEGRLPGGGGLGDLLPGDDLLPGLPVFPGAGDTFAGIVPGLGETSPDQFEGYRVDEDDRPAADIQQQAAGFQRLTMAALVFAGDLGAVVLLGALAIAVILAQVFVLLFLAFAPLALVAGVFPGAGHALFQEWLRRLAGALVRKAFYSLVLAAVLAVGSAPPTRWAGSTPSGSRRPSTGPSSSSGTRSAGASRRRRGPASTLISGPCAPGGSVDCSSKRHDPFARALTASRATASWKAGAVVFPIVRRLRRLRAPSAPSANAVSPPAPQRRRSGPPPRSNLSPLPGALSRPTSGRRAPVRPPRSPARARPRGPCRGQVGQAIQPRP